MSEIEHTDDRLWPQGWEGHRIAQLRYWASLPLYVKIAWLEEAQRLATQLSKSSRKSSSSPDTETGNHSAHG